MVIVFFFNDKATTEIYTLSLHDALPISHRRDKKNLHGKTLTASAGARCIWIVELESFSTIQMQRAPADAVRVLPRSEEHTSELQSLTNIVCRLLLEKK